jgi:hypothetical protein
MTQAKNVCRVVLGTHKQASGAETAEALQHIKLHCLAGTASCAVLQHEQKASTAKP